MNTLDEPAGCHARIVMSQGQRGQLAQILLARDHKLVGRVERRQVVVPYGYQAAATATRRSRYGVRVIGIIIN